MSYFRFDEAQAGAARALTATFVSSLDPCLQVLHVCQYLVDRMPPAIDVESLFQFLTFTPHLLESLAKRMLASEAQSRASCFVFIV